MKMSFKFIRIIKYILIFVLPLTFSSCAPPAKSETVPVTYSNPVIPGYYPDPSICRVGDTFYVVNSTFEWFPGITIQKSKDLVNWEPIGHVIERKGQIAENLNIWAPTIRYHKGLFYVICTERPGKVFYCTATNPSGDWSDAVYFDIDSETVSAIDPSLYWDEDGTCWLAANDRVKSGTNMHWCWIQKVDLTPVEKNGRMEGSFIGERKYITDGSGIGSDKYAEGPHIFKYKNWYYLMIAEGGTWANHAVSFLRTKDLNGPAEDWEYHPDNPVLTHRGKESLISATGHADMVETQNGEWWSMHLGVRKQDGKHKLGRETFLVPVKWINKGVDNWWPYFNPDKGNMTLMEDTRPDLIWTPVEAWPGKDEFETEHLRPEWTFYYMPKDSSWWNVSDGKLNIKLLSENAKAKSGFAFIGRRQQHHNFDVKTVLSFNPKSENEVAGIFAGIKNTNHIRLEIGKKGENTIASIYHVTKKGENKTGEAIIPDINKDYFIKLEARGWDFQFYVGTSAHDLIAVGDIQDARTMSSEEAGGFTGSFVGVYASSNGKESETLASYDWFEYKKVKVSK